jgi:dihydrofolate synthase/folylpolyglutamate synthase
MDALNALGAQVQRAGIDFHVERHAGGWRWAHSDGSVLDLPDPALAAPVQYANAAASIAALHALPGSEPWQRREIFADIAAKGLRRVRIAARLQSLGGDPELIVDVGHNPQAARALAQWLDRTPGGRVHAVYGALADKDVDGVIAALGERIAHWHVAGLDRDTPRGLSADAVADRVRAVLSDAQVDRHPGVGEALAAARSIAQPGERVLAFGSFFVASAVLAEST